MFSIKESIKTGWQLTKASFWKIIGLVAIAAIPSAFVSILNNTNQDNNSIPLALLYAALSIISMILGIGLLKMLLRIYDGESPDTKEIFSAQGVFWKYLGTSILYSLIILGGFILLIVPGIIWAIKYSFATLIVVDTKSGPMTALKESGRLTEGSKWKIAGFGLVAGLIMIAGYIALYVGSLVATPIVMFAWIYVYRVLTKAKAALTETSPSAPSPQTV